jgi:hypothetical protein
MDGITVRIRLEHEATWPSMVIGIILYHFTQGYTRNEVLRQQAILGCLFERMTGEDLLAGRNENNDAAEGFARSHAYSAALTAGARFVGRRFNSSAKNLPV